MKPDKSTRSEILQNIEINVRSLYVKAARMNRCDFRAFLLFSTLIALIGVVGAVLIVK